jgi:hypothetical protein
MFKEMKKKIDNHSVHTLVFMFNNYIQYRGSLSNTVISFIYLIHQSFKYCYSCTEKKIMRRSFINYRIIFIQSNEIEIKFLEIEILHFQS